MVWNLTRSGIEQEDEGLKMLQKFCRRKYRHSLTNALKSSRIHKRESVAAETQSVESIGLNRNNVATDTIDHGEYNIYNEETSQPTVYDVIEEILSSQSKLSVLFVSSTNRPIRCHPIKLIWYNLEFKFGRWIKCALLLLVLIAYALFGGLLVHQLEAPAERELIAQLDQKTIERHKIYAKKISGLFTSSHCQSITERSDEQNSTEIAPLLKQITCNRRLERLLEEYDELMGILNYKHNLWRWADYWNAVFYCGTIFTTIGPDFYYFICFTRCAVYASSTERIWKADSSVRTQYLAFYPEMFQVLCTIYFKVSNEAQVKIKKIREAVKNNNRDSNENDANNENDDYETFPIYGAILIIIVYIALCSFIFRIWEHWDYFTAFYFFFISLTTVGLGDEMPAHPHFACVFFIFFIVGLALVSMCVSSVQMEFEMRFMKAINLIDEYSRERQRRDQKSLLKTAGGPVRFINSVPVLNPLAFIPTVSNSLTKERYLFHDRLRFYMLQ
ncbi:unnamed protein product [Acanthocheilonema viteae]|uniref:Potassium channel domain-containing protein n=1 Tax=Acanthocheilonema viteae TaxID=6277 RepID=A0A498RZU7_ACAVI|nr:unnamed protein product [Acanthocheilonema viteae]